MAQASRRSLLAGLAAAPMAAAPLHAAQPSAERLNDLWARTMAEMAACRAIDEEIHARVDTLPWWAKPGPKYITSPDSPNNQREEISHDPAIQDMKPPSTNGYKMIRPSRADIQRDYDNFPESEPARRHYEQRLADYAARRAAQQEARAAAGIDGLDAEFDRHSDLQWELILLVRAEAAQAGLPGLAALVVLDLGLDASSHECLDVHYLAALAALRGLLPHTAPGPLAETVRTLLENAHRPFGFGPLWDFHCTEETLEQMRRLQA